jgi:hypothetical protein
MALVGQRFVQYLEELSGAHKMIKNMNFERCANVVCTANLQRCFPGFRPIIVSIVFFCCSCHCRMQREAPDCCCSHGVAIVIVGCRGKRLIVVDLVDIWLGERLSSSHTALKSTASKSFHLVLGGGAFHPAMVMTMEERSVPSLTMEGRLLRTLFSFVIHAVDCETGSNRCRTLCRSCTMS